MHKSNNTSHAPQNNPNKRQNNLNKHQSQISLQIWRHVPGALLPPKSQWNQPTTTPGGRERHAAPPPAHTSSGVKKRRAMHRETMRCEHCSNHQMRRMPSEPSANKPPRPSTRCPRTPQGWGLRTAHREVPATGVATGPWPANCARDSQRHTETCNLRTGGQAGGTGVGAQKGAPRSAHRQGEEQHRHTGCRSHTRTRASTADKEEGHSKAGEATRTGNQNGGDGRVCPWEAATTKGMAWPASPVATGCQGNPCSTGIRWGVSPAAQMGCLRNRSGSPLGADQP